MEKIGEHPEYVPPVDVREGKQYKYESGADFLSILKEFEPVEDEETKKRLKKLGLMQAAGDLAKHLGAFAGMGYAPVEKRQDNKRLYETLEKFDYEDKDFNRRMQAYREKAAGLKLSDMQQQRSLYEADLDRRQAIENAKSQYKNNLNMQDRNLRIQNNTTNTQTTNSNGSQTTTVNPDLNNSDKNKDLVSFMDTKAGINYTMSKDTARSVVSTLQEFEYLTETDKNGVLNNIFGVQGWEGYNERWQRAMLALRQDAERNVYKNGKSMREVWNNLMNNNRYIMRQPLYRGDYYKQPKPNPINNLKNGVNLFTPKSIINGVKKGIDALNNTRNANLSDTTTNIGTQNSAKIDEEQKKINEIFGN
jgi:hypothetical protein